MKVIKGTFTIVSYVDIPAQEVFDALLLAKEELSQNCEVLMGASIDERTDDGKDEV